MATNKLHRGGRVPVDTRMKFIFKSVEGTENSDRRHILVIVEDHPVLFGIGNTQPEAIGNMVWNHRDFFGIKMGFDPSQIVVQQFGKDRVTTSE